MNFGKAFRECREEMDLTREKTAEMTGFSLPTFSKIERGKTIPKQSTIEKFCKKIGVPVAWFYYCAMEPQDFRL